MKLSRKLHWVGMILRKTFIILKQVRQNISETIILQKLWFEIYLKSWLPLPVFHSLNRLFLAFLYLVPSLENSRLKNFDFNVYLSHRHSTVFSKNTFLLLKEKLFKSRYDKEKTVSRDSTVRWSNFKLSLNWRKPKNRVQFSWPKVLAKYNRKKRTQKFNFSFYITLKNQTWLCRPCLLCPNKGIVIEWDRIG